METREILPTHTNDTNILERNICLLSQGYSVDELTNHAPSSHPDGHLQQKMRVFCQHSCSQNHTLLDTDSHTNIFSCKIQRTTQCLLLHNLGKEVKRWKHAISEILFYSISLLCCLLWHFSEAVVVRRSKLETRLRRLRRNQERRRKQERPRLSEWCSRGR